MVERILVPMDRSTLAEQALSYAFELYPEADITVFHVVGVPSKMMGEAAGLALEDDIDAAAHRHAEPVFTKAKTIAAESDRSIDTAIGLGQPGRAIVRKAEAFDAIVMGSHGRHSEDITRSFLVGNVAKTVFQRSPVSVTTVR